MTTSYPRDPARAATWPDLLAAAESPEELFDVVRDYLATWTPQELASLPRQCVPPHRFALPEEIVTFTFTLVEHHLKSRGDNASLARLEGFFSHASRCVAKLMSERAQPGAANGEAVE